MDVDTEYVRELLAEVRRTSAAARASRAKADADSAERRAAVRIAMEAGVPRQVIADAAGTHRNNVYRIVSENPRR